MIARQATAATALAGLLLCGCTAATPHSATGSPADTAGIAPPPTVPAVLPRLPVARAPVAMAPARPGSASQLLAGADPTDATAVGQVFALGTWTIDASTDSSEVDAEARLVNLMTPDLAAQVEEAGGTVQPTAEFALWRQHAAVTTASAVATHDAGAPPDTPTSADRSFAITVTPRGRDGWVGPPMTAIEFITLSRPGPGEPWRIADVH